MQPYLAQTLVTNENAITWKSLTDGLFGGLFGATGAFGAALIAIRYERRARRRSDTAEAALRLAERRRRAVAAVSLSFVALESEIRWAPFFMGRTNRVLTNALMTFNSEVGSDHPDVLAWLLQRRGKFEEISAQWRELWWLPTSRRNAVLQDLGRTVGEISGVLSQWSTG